MPGLLPRKYKSQKRYSYPRTFGTTSVLSDCDFDTGLSNFNQNEPNQVTDDPALPNGCTDFARADIATNEDHIIYKPGFSYGKSCLIANVPFGSALPLETAFKSGIVYGLQAVGETTDAQALAHRRGPYFEVHPLNGQDYFDAIWSAMLLGKKCVSVGAPWFPEMTESASISDVNLRPATDWHAWEACGVKTTNGIPWMKVKWWGGEPKWFGRNAVNSLLSVSGSDCICDTDGKATPADIKTVRLNIIEVLISFYQELLNSFQPTAGSTYDYFEEEIQSIEKEITNITNHTMPEQTLNPNPDALLPWNTTQSFSHENFHNVRDICDLEGLTYEQKEILTACVWQESEFMTSPRPNQNKLQDGTVWSSDFGIVQVNDYFNIGEGKPFPSVEYVITNPEACVRWMARIYKTTGALQPWASFTTGAYKAHLGKTL